MTEEGRQEEPILPPLERRWGGARYRDDERFVSWARESTRLLVERADLGTDSRVLDVGCGPGRLGIGIRSVLGTVREYHGVDVHEASILWAKEALEGRYPWMRFTWIDARNERYNPDGVQVTDQERLPVATAAYDVVSLLSVFSHMYLRDIGLYLRELRRSLAPGGVVYLTMFAELGVPDEEVNPDDYLHEWSGPLHCVRIDRHVFERLVATSGLTVRSFFAHDHPDGQSTYTLIRAEDAKVRPGFTPP